MLRKSEWILDRRPIHTKRGAYSPTIPWEAWTKAYCTARENWLMSIIETLLKNNDWAGSFLLIQTYVSAMKQAEGTKFWNRTPFDESARVRAMKHWFWSLCEEYGFTSPEEEVPYSDLDLGSRRSVEAVAAEQYPFVGGKPKRRYSETAEFFSGLEEDRKNTRRKAKEYQETAAKRKRA